MSKIGFGVAAAVAILAPSSAWADSWALIDATETPGDRSIYYALYDAVKRFGDPALSDDGELVEVEVVQVFEAANRPRVSNFRVLADCAARRIRIAEVDSLFRDGSTAMGQAGTEWMPIPPATWLSRVGVIACDRGAIEAAIRASTNEQSSEPLLELGLLPVGDMVGTYPLIELTWTAFWTDATEPPVRPLSPEEEREMRSGVERRLADLRAEVAGYVAVAEASLADQDEERRFMTEVAATLAAKPRVQRALFAGMAGWTETEVIEIWGWPDRVRSMPYGEAFDYSATVDTREVIVELWANGSETAREVGEFEHCDMTLWMRQGGSRPGLRVVDVEVTGDNCRRSTLGGMVR